MIIQPSSLALPWFALIILSRAVLNLKSSCLATWGGIISAPWSSRKCGKLAAKTDGICSRPFWSGWCHVSLYVTSIKQIFHWVRRPLTSSSAGMLQGLLFCPFWDSGPSSFKSLSLLPMLAHSCLATPALRSRWSKLGQDLPGHPSCHKEGLTGLWRLWQPLLSLVEQGREDCQNLPYRPWLAGGEWDSLAGLILAGWVGGVSNKRLWGRQTRKGRLLLWSAWPV